ncbi:unnamed protein product, partial [Ectocarpus fasciculatus]
SPQGQICGNDIEVPDNDDDGDVNYYYDQLMPCDSSPTPAPGSTSAQPATEATTEAMAEAMAEESSGSTIKPTTESTPAATPEPT